MENGEEIVKVSKMQVPNGISHEKYMNGKYSFFFYVLNTLEKLFEYEVFCGPNFVTLFLK